MCCEKNKYEKCICDLNERLEQLENDFLNFNLNAQDILDYKVYSGLVKRNYTTRTQGILTVGNVYIIETLIAGDDFSNVGYVADGVPFTATGTMPTNWNNNTVIIDETNSQPEVIEFVNTIGETFSWDYTYLNGIIASTTNPILLEDKVAILKGNEGQITTTPNGFYRIDDMSFKFEGHETVSTAIKLFFEVRFYN